MIHLEIPRETPLSALYEQRGLATSRVHGFLVADHFGNPAQEHAALTGSAGIVDLSYLYKLEVRGARARNEADGRSEISLWRISERRVLLTAGLPFRLNDPDLQAIDLTETMACFALVGPRAAEVLQKLAPIDLRETVLPIFACTPTLAAEVQTFIARSPEAFYLFVPRDAALSFWHAVQHRGAVPCGELAWQEFLK